MFNFALETHLLCNLCYTQDPLSGFCYCGFYFPELPVPMTTLSPGQEVRKNLSSRVTAAIKSCFFGEWKKVRTSITFGC